MFYSSQFKNDLHTFPQFFVVDYYNQIIDITILKVKDGFYVISVQPTKSDVNFHL